MNDEEKTRTEKNQTVLTGDYEGVLAGRRQFVEDQLSKKILIKKNERTEELNRQGFARHYLCKYTLNDTALQDWICFVFHYKKHSGKHRHQGGLVIYVLEGKGATEIDGERLEWEPGDMILLPIKPDGVEHKHYNYDEQAGCKWIAFINIPLWDHVASEMAQLELSPEFIARYGNIAGGITAPTKYSRREVQPHKIGKPELTKQGAASGAQGPKTLFDELIRRRDEERRQRESAIWLIKGKSLQWESNAHGWMRWYLHPSMQNLAIRTLMSYVQEIPPGGKSGRQQHPGNAIMYVLAGRGYTVLDGEKYEWEEGDVMTLPLRQGGVVYQHFNSDRGQPVRLIAVEPNLIDATGIDRGSGFEELEPAPPVPL